MSVKKRGLGRGLDALLGIDTGAAMAEQDSARTEGELRDLPIEWLKPGKYQPRTGMDPERLQELADSIKAQGLVQPIVVRSIGPDRYEIVAGERRWRASQLAGMRTIPSLVRIIPDQAAIAMALIENIQREDLHPLEEAQALERLIDEFELTHQQAAEAVGRSRAMVSNLLRLRDLEPEVKALINERRIEMGHARALLALTGVRQVNAAREVAAKGLSVRETEALVRAALAAPQATTKLKRKLNPDVARLAQDLSEKIGARVAIEDRRGKGRLVIHYSSLDELDGILGRIR
jgi:ParB family transcriptional regulator, chromosome partitioning protein